MAWYFLSRTSHVELMHTVDPCVQHGGFTQMSGNCGRCRNPEDELATELLYPGS